MTSSTSNKEELNSELESFRQQWLSDLRTRNDHEHEQLQRSGAGPSRPSKRRPSHHGPSGAPNRRSLDIENDQAYLQGRTFDEPSSSSHNVQGKAKVVEKQLVSALDHYEEAMEKEAQGNMGDSLKLYRKAYRVLTTLLTSRAFPLTIYHSWIAVLIGLIVKSTSHPNQPRNLKLTNAPPQPQPPSPLLPQQKHPSNPSTT